MSFKYYNEKTGRYEPFTIPALKGERGERGIQGPKGDKGDKGEKGDPGTASLAINDNVTNTASAWSGQKIAQELELKIGFRYLD